MKKLNSNLEAIIKSRGIKQKWIAEKLNVRPSTISDIVQNKSVPSLALALAVARVLDLKIEDIWTERI
ncbi:helix-turn-helix transcriptional regulator [Sutcliffiella horikoshii]|uniref:helix-turn-helix transcriptional regulator n=1 Tax=Sutcliffiella horikoshii TaxID=79883 RepID=UPI00384B16EF